MCLSLCQPLSPFGWDPGVPAKAWGKGEGPAEYSHGPTEKVSVHGGEYRCEGTVDAIARAFLRIFSGFDAVGSEGRVSPLNSRFDRWVRPVEPAVLKGKRADCQPRRNGSKRRWRRR